MNEHLPLDEDLEELDQKITALEQDRLLTLPWSRPQKRFMGSSARATLFVGANKAAGKTSSLLGLVTAHVLRRYPTWWTGPRAPAGPFLALVGGKDHKLTREALSDGLLGIFGARGSGFIPADRIVSIATNKASSLAHSVDYALIEDDEGGLNRIVFFSEQQGRDALQHYNAWLVAKDEECLRMSTFSELKARLLFTGGHYYGTAIGWRAEEYFNTFANSDDPTQHVLVQSHLDECDHLSYEKREEMRRAMESLPFGLTRISGMPEKGVGIIYPVPWERLQCNPFPIPHHWPKVIGMDFPITTGMFAAALIAHDTKTDTLYLTAEYKAANKPRTTHAEAVIRMGGKVLPCAWPHDAGRKEDQGGTVADDYRRLGLAMLPFHAHFLTADRQKSKHLSVVWEELGTRMAEGRFKVFSGCTDFRDELGSYVTIEGRVPDKNNDHVIDAVHKAVMMLRYARPGDHPDPVMVSGLTGEPMLDMRTESAWFGGDFFAG